MKTNQESIESLAAQLKVLSESLANAHPDELSPKRLSTIRRTITESYERLRKLAGELDPIKHPGFVFDPANPNIVGRIIGIALVAQDRKQLSKVDRFYGSGVYAIYYRGEFSPYKAIANKEHPIYVGKADPADAASKSAVEQGDRLSNRLNDHRKNISKAAGTLRIEDFEYRALVVQTGWQGAAEDYLIDLFKPIWNSEISICYGFGKHGDDPGTRSNLRSPWDTLHPGRDWAHRDPEMKDAREKDRIVQDIRQHLKDYPPFSSVDEILRNFLSEMRAIS
jgi:hypothetical protein